MRKIFVVMLVVFATVSLAGAAPAYAQESGTVEMEREFVALLNDLRASKGLPALALHEDLVGKARRWSGTMAAEGDIWHSDLREGITAPWRRLGENVGMGGSVRGLHDALVASPSHYENLIDPGFNYVGLGVVVDTEGTIFVSQEFMELAQAPAPTPVPSLPEAEATNSSGEPGTAVSFQLTDPVSVPTPAAVKGDARRSAAPISSPDQRQADNSRDDGAATASGDGTRALAMRPVLSTTPAQFLALAAAVLLAAVASGLRSIAACRVARATHGR